MKKTGVGVLVVGGEMPPLKRVLEVIEGADLIVAADSGFDFIQDHGLPFDYMVGDMDSTRYVDLLEQIPPDKVTRASRDKDETDTELGMDLLLQKGTQHKVILGGGGGRLDHLLGIVSLFDRENYPNEWYTSREVVYSIDRPMFFRGWKGDTVSFFPAGNQGCSMRSRGLKWPLDGLVWEHGQQGISNIVTEDELEVEPLQGRLICIHSVETI